jgi:predicted PurR-regulated permease PerM
MPTLFSFISLFGGAALWGLKGLIIGPVEETRDPRQPTP